MVKSSAISGANELTEDIRRQAWKMDARIISVLTAGLLISLLLIVLFSRRLSANIDIITDGLSTLAQNIPTRLPQLPGEMGQIEARASTTSPRHCVKREHLTI